MTIISEPLFTQHFEDEDTFLPDSGSVYIFASGFEERGRVEAAWRGARSTILFTEVKEQAPLHITIHAAHGDVRIPTRGSRGISEFLTTFPSGTVIYLDITNMDHSTWAPLVRECARASDHPLRVVYSEPLQYKLSKTPTEGDIYDLSEGVVGISALPGFARLPQGAASDVCFIPLLGFEGTRFAHIRENVQPPDNKIIPIVGVPGFRPEFPFSAYLGNRLPLLETRAWRRSRFARANCPFSLYYVLEELHQAYPGHILKIAPIGTKPHALGAVLFALQNSSCTELVYDHPVRKAGRTSGRARILVYTVSEFLA